MPIEVVKRYRRADLQANRGKLFVFGDNVSTLGRGGQAKECRGEPNAIGIPTKWHPTNDAGAFFDDSALETVKPRIQSEFRKLAEHIRAGGTVVLPADGVGTGLARLPECAPVVHRYIEQCFAHLAEIARLTSPERVAGEG